MKRIYLKTIFSAPNEIKFIKMNLHEAFDHIDKFFVCESNRSHTGAEKSLIFKEHLKKDFSEIEREKIEYIPSDISELTEYSNTDGKVIHRNENLIRGIFEREVKLHSNDIIFSVDADEILYSHVYEKALDEIGFFRKALKLKLHQFFYRMNYLWVGKEFIAPTVCKVSFYKNKFPGQWRYDGKLLEEWAGCHFSWQLTVEEMVWKLKNYSHTHDYGHLANKEILEDAINKKKYPFDPKVNFDIQVLDVDKSSDLYPKSFYVLKEHFKDLIV